MSSDRIKLEKPEAAFASWLATLDNPTAAPQLRDEALKRVSQMYLYERRDLALLRQQLEDRDRRVQAQALRIETLEKEAEAADELRRRLATSALQVAELALNKKDGPAIAVFISPAPQTSAPASPPRLHVVPKEGA